ncbi:poly A polymerase, head domain-containing protein [Tanacetum coccineum]
MAIAVSQGFACRTQLSFNLPLINRVHKVRQTFTVAAIESLVESVSVNNDYQTSSATNAKGNDDCKPHEWKKLCSKELGIRTSRITKPAKTVLNVLRKKGYDVYLVGGCVRDLVLKRTPKDFDILTTAELKEVSFLIHFLIGYRA